MRTLAAAGLLAMAVTANGAELGRLTEETRSEIGRMLPKVVDLMKSALESQGAAAAIPVCKERAPAMMAARAAQLGWKIRRVSLKTRNAERATPDDWERRQLEDFDRRAAAGEAAAGIEVAAIVADGQGGQIFRYLKALPVAPVCVQCHGERDNLSPQLLQALQRDYPHDRATGYAAGDIRGAVSVQRPL